MSSDFTEFQTAGEKMHAEEMSRVPTVPPSQIPGYRIDRMLGRGAFGQVWVGVDRNTGRTVAIKFYMHHSKMDWKLLSREVRHLVSMAADRNIVQVLAVGWDHEPPYYVMEYLENGSLEDLIRKRGRLEVHEALHQFTQIAAALKHSHGRGILHCDLKPANILLDPLLQPRLADFGQSRMSNEQTPSLGTLFYMAPEQADLNALPDARWDVYALGAIFYCMLTGDPPYYTSERVTTLKTAKDLPERLEKYRTMLQRSPAPKQHYKVKGVDKSLATIIDRMLAPHPEQRIENVQQVVDALVQRDAQKLRKPLTLLGVVGPIVLLAVMSLFFWRGISTAKQQSTLRLQQEAKQSNSFAARLAAQRMEQHIAALYQIVENEADRQSLRSNMTSTITAFDEVGWKRFVQQTPPPSLLNQFLTQSARNDLEIYLRNAFDRFNSKESQTYGAAQIDSMFVVDRFGTMLATAFNEPVENTKVGYNFAYRSYFNGLAQDGSAASDHTKYSAYLATHLSPPFLSTTTGDWKIAISTPVWQPNSSAEEDDQFEAKKSRAELIGVLVITIKLGDFKLLTDEPVQDDAPSNTSTNIERFAVLVDGRKGEHEGDLVQHPLLDSLSDHTDANQGNEPVSFQIDKTQLSILRRGGLLNYRDPAAQHPKGTAYQGEWIAALEPIQLPYREPSDGTAMIDASGREMLVLVQVPATKIATPVQELVNAMTREFAFAIFVILAVIGSLWFFGSRMYPARANA